MSDDGSPASVVRQLRVEWSDTDAAGHQHFTAVLRWVESAEALLHDRLGIRDQTWGRMPRVRVECDYSARLWHWDLLDVQIAVTRVGRSSLEYAFTVRRGSDVAARGRLTVVLSDPGAGSRPWPDDVRKALETGGPQEPERLTR